MALHNLMSCNIITVCCHYDVVNTQTVINQKKYKNPLRQLQLIQKLRNLNTSQQVSSRASVCQRAQFNVLLSINVSVASDQNTSLTVSYHQTPLVLSGHQVIRSPGCSQTPN